MKHTLFLFLTGLILLMVKTAYGQGGVQFGAHAGINAANFSGSEISYDSRLGFTAGISVGIPLVGKPFQIESGLFYSQKGAKGEYRDPFEAPCCNAGNSGTLKTDYIDVPILAVFDFDRSGSFHPQIVAGPYVAVNISAKANEADDLYIEKIDEYINTFDVGILIGGGGVLRTDTLNLRFRASYGVGFMPVFNSEVDGDEKHRVLSFTAGIIF